MIELYNSQFAKSHGLPVADADFVKFVTQRGGLSAMRFSIGLGYTTIAGSNTHDPCSGRAASRACSSGIVEQGDADRHDRCRSSTSSAGTASTSGDEAATTYSSIIVTLKDKNQIAVVLRSGCRTAQDLRLEDSLGEKFATVLFVVAPRARPDLARHHRHQRDQHRPQLLHAGHGAAPRARACCGRSGRPSADVQLVVLGEAGLIGLIGGVLGVLVGARYRPRASTTRRTITCRGSRSSPRPGSTSAGGSGSVALGVVRPCFCVRRRVPAGAPRLEDGAGAGAGSELTHPGTVPISYA